jgi:four helix bundle protein
MKESNVVLDKSYGFALRVVKMYQYLKKTKKEDVLSRQVLRSDTSIGANVEEAIGGQSDRDFLAKMSIAYKEARETRYWFRLLRDSEILKKKPSNSIIADVEELLRILGSILRTMKNKKESAGIKCS